MPVMPAWAKRFAANSAWTISGTAIATACLFAEMAILARYLGPQALGVLLLIFAFPEAVQQLLDFRVRETMTVFLSRFMARKQWREAVALLKMLWLVDVGVALVALLIVLATAGLVAEPLGAGDHVGLIRLYAVGVAITALDSASGSVLRVMDRFRLAFVVAAVSNILRLSLIAAIAAGDGTLGDLVLGRISADLITTLAFAVTSVVVLARPLGPYRDTRARDIKPHFPEVRAMMLASNGIGILKMVGSRLDLIVIGVLATPAVVALYRTGSQFARLPMAFGDALNSVIFPALSRELAVGRTDRARQMVRSSTLALAAGLLPVLILGVLANGWIAELALGKEFRDAGPVFAIGLLATIPSVVVYWSYPLVLSLGRIRSAMVAVAASVVGQFVLIFALVPGLDEIGAAIAMAGGQLISVAWLVRTGLAGIRADAPSPDV
jgi:O-antigen/teichoic acid export membrane protein